MLVTRTPPVTRSQLRNLNAGERRPTPSRLVARFDNNMNADRATYAERVSKAFRLIEPQISKYSGGPDISQFMRNFITVLNRAQIERDVAHALLPMCLAGKALRRFNALPEAIQGDYKEAFKKLAAQFKSAKNAVASLEKMQAVHQESAEDTIDYAERCELALKEVFGDEAPLNTKTMVAFFIKGLLPEVKEKMILEGDHENWQEAVNKAVRLEQALDTFAQAKRRELALQNEINYLTDRLDALEGNARGRNRMRGFGRHGPPTFRPEREGTRYRSPSRTRGNWRGRGYQAWRRGTWGNFVNAITTTFLVATMILSAESLTQESYQLYGTARGGDYYVPPIIANCTIERPEASAEVAVDLYKENLTPTRLNGYRCTRIKTLYSVPSLSYIIKSWLHEVHRTNEGVSVEDCKKAFNDMTFEGEPLIQMAQGFFKTDTTVDYSPMAEKEQSVTTFVLEKGEIAVTPGSKLISPLGNLSPSCTPTQGYCVMQNDTFVWEIPHETAGCQHKFLGTFQAKVSVKHIIIADRGIAARVENAVMSEKERRCFQGPPIKLSGGLITVIKDASIRNTLQQIVENRALSKRTVDHAAITVETIFGRGFHLRNFPRVEFPMRDARILGAMAKEQISYQEVEFHWTHYVIADRYLAILRAFREKQLRDIMKAQLRSTPRGPNFAKLWNETMFPSHRYDGFLDAEFGYAKPITQQEEINRKRREDRLDTFQELPTPEAIAYHQWAMRERAQKALSGAQQRQEAQTTKQMPYHHHEVPRTTTQKSTQKTTTSKNVGKREDADAARYYAELHRLAETQKLNDLQREINTKISYLYERQTEINQREFQVMYRHICNLQNAQIRLQLTVLKTDQTMGARLLLNRDDVAARYVGDVLLVTPCKQVTPDKVYKDHKRAGKCYEQMPVEVGDKTYFVIPGTRDLVEGASEIPCELLPLPVHLNTKGNYSTSNGEVLVKEMSYERAQLKEQEELTFNAPCVFLDTVDGELSIAYARALANKMSIVARQHEEIRQALQQQGFFPEFRALNNATSTIKGLLRNMSEKAMEGMEELKNTIFKVVLKVIIPIAILVFVVLVAYYLIKIYLARRITAVSAARVFELAQRGTPRLRQALSRYIRGSINAINEDDEVHNMEHRHSLISMPSINLICLSQGVRSLPYAYVNVNNRQVAALIDSGASISFFSQTTCEEIGLLLDSTKSLTAKAANGSAIPFTAQTRALVTMAGQTVRHEFWVANNAPAPLLLGTDFLKKLPGKVTFDFAQKRIEIDGNAIPLISKHQMQTFPVIAKNSYTIPGQSMVQIVCQMESQENLENENIIVEGAVTNEHTFDEDKLIAVCPSLDTAETNGDVWVRFWNTSKAPVQIRKGKRVAQAQLLNEVVNHVMGKIEGIPESPELKIDNYRDLGEAPPNTQWFRDLKLDECDLSESGKNQLEKIIRKHSRAFVNDDGKIGHFKGKTKHRIDLEPDFKIPQARPYPANARMKKEIESQIEMMLRNGVIEESASAFSSPILLIPKPSGEYRFVVDFRKLNKYTKKRVYILPTVQEITDTAMPKRFFTVVDIAIGFNNVDMEPEHRERTAFAVHLGLYQFSRLPMGLCGAPDTFMRAINEMKRRLKANVLAYLDDLVIASETEEEHLRDVEEVLSRIEDFGFKLKPSKCQLARKEVNLLGFVISQNTIRPNQKKVECIMQYPKPDTVRELQAFLGLINYFRRFIKDFAVIAAPLHELTKLPTEGGNPQTTIAAKSRTSTARENSRRMIPWNEEAENAFEKLKLALTQEPVLQAPDLRRPFRMETDASTQGLSAILMQEDRAGKLHVIAYWSRRTKGAEPKYPAIELEALALLFGLKKNHMYIYGSQVTCVTDHQPLVSLLTRNDLTGRLAKFQALIQEYNVNIIYRKGAHNCVADALSRHLGGPPIEEVLDTVNAITISWNLAQIKEEQDHDPKLREVKEALRTGNDDENDKYIVIDNVLYHVPGGVNDSPKIVIPEASPLRIEFIRTVHETADEAGHLGVLKTKRRLADVAVWNHMETDIRNFIRGCESCQRRKNPGTYEIRQPLGSYGIPKTIAERIHVDVVGPFAQTIRGNRLIIAAVDAFSKYVVAQAIPDQTSETLRVFLMERVVALFGCPTTIVSDQGSNFLSDNFRTALRKMGIEHVATSAYHHQANGLVEKFNNTLEIMMTQFKTLDEWDNILPLVTLAINRCINETSKVSPSRVLFGFSPTSPFELQLGRPKPSFASPEGFVYHMEYYLNDIRTIVYKNLERGHERHKMYYDAKSTGPNPFRVGQKVLLKRETASKLDFQYTKPLTVVDILGHNLILEAEDGSKVKVVNANRVRLYNPPTTPPTTMNNATATATTPTTPPTTMNNATATKPTTPTPPPRRSARLANRGQ